MAARRVLFDTNVLVSAAYFGGVPARVVDLARERRVHGLTSLHILGEFRDVVSRPRFGFTTAEAEEAAIDIASFTEVVPIESSPERSTPDPDDDPVLLAAILGKADFIVTGDSHLVGLVDPPVRVVTCSQLLDELDT